MCKMVDSKGCIRLIKFPSLIYFSLIFCLSDVSFVQGNISGHLVLMPNNDKQETGCVVVVFPDEAVQPEAYIDLGHSLVSAGRRWSIGVVIVNYGHYRPLLNQNVPDILADVLDKLVTSHNVSQSRKLFLASHGSSVFPVQDYVDMNPHTTSGLILLGAEVRRGPSLPVPILLLFAEFDTSLRMSKAADLFRKMLSISGGSTEVMMRNPVVVVPSTDQRAFSTGNQTTRVPVTHLEAVAVSRRRVARTVVSFVLFILGLPEDSSPQERQIHKDLLQTQDFLQPFLGLHDLAFNKKTERSEWTKFAQIWLSGVPRELAASLQVQGLRTLGDGDFKPLMYETEHFWNIFTWLQIEKSTGNDVTPGQSSAMIKAKMVDSAKIHHFLGIIDILNITSVRTCKDMNYAAFMTAYHTASTTARKRYDSTHPGIIFEEDHEVDSESEWNAATLKIDWVGKIIHVTASSWKRRFTGTGISDGTIYCTLLPPGDALEWIYHDSLFV